MFRLESNYKKYQKEYTLQEIPSISRAVDSLGPQLLILPVNVVPNQGPVPQFEFVQWQSWQPVVACASSFVPGIIIDGAPLEIRFHLRPNELTNTSRLLPGYKAGFFPYAFIQSSSILAI